MASRTVFISYSRHDQEFVDRLTADLRRHGAEIWIDRESISPGTNWQDELEIGLSRAAVLLYVISPSSVKSAWMSAEVGAAFAHGKQIIPLLLKNVAPETLPPFIAQIQWVDFRESYDSALHALVQGLKLISAESTSLAPRKRSAQRPKRKSKGYAFISYSEPDRDFVQPLKAFLKAHGYSYWDYEESDRDYHSQLFLELEGVIQEASATLCVLSEAWKRSQWTVKEFFFSQDVGTPVFLLKAKSLGPTLAIAGLTYVDFTKGEPAAFAKLDRELKRKHL